MSPAPDTSSSRRARSQVTNDPAAARLAIAVTAAILLPVLGLSFAAASAWGAQVPDPLASHFASDGTPDGSYSRFVHDLLTLWAPVVLGVGALAVLAMGARVRVAGPLAALLAFLAVMFAGVGISILDVNRGATIWTDAENLSAAVLFGQVAVSLGVAALVGALGARAFPLVPSDDERERPTASLGAGEQASWNQTMRVRWAGWTAAGIVLLALLLGLVAPGWVVGVTLLSALPALAFSRIDVSASVAGLRVRFGPLGWPVVRIPLEDIDEATAGEESAMEWGGWGYRGSVRIFGAAAVVVRGGEGIRVRLTNGKTFGVTVDDAATGAGVLNDLLARRDGVPAPG